MTDNDKKEVKQMMIEVLVDFWEQVFPTLATKEDIQEIQNKMATKDDLKKVEVKLAHAIEKVAADVKDIKRRVLNIESNTPTRVEFNRLRDKVDKKIGIS